MGLFEVGGSEHRSSVVVSRRTVTGSASISGPASAKVKVFETARNSTKRLWCRSLQLLVEALSGKAFVRMGRNMQTRSGGWVESMSPWFAVASWTLNRVYVLREQCHIAHERGPGKP
jgi:hypothetical protein